jgi:hypothetical protein
MIQRLQNIGRMKLSGDPAKDIEALHKVTAKLEEFLCNKMPNQANANADLTTLQAQINAMQTTINGLSIAVVTNAWPGLGDDHVHAAFGDHAHGQNKFFTKQGSAVATLGVNTVTFDSTFAFTSAPNIWCWLQQTDGSFSPLVVQSGDITVAGFTVSVINVDGSPDLKYYAIGS